MEMDQKNAAVQGVVCLTMIQAKVRGRCGRRAGEVTNVWFKSNTN
jgi:hypothetical protein